MQTIIGGAVLLILFIAVLVGVYHEIKCMKANQRKIEEEYRFFRSFRKYLEELEANCHCGQTEI